LLTLNLNGAGIDRLSINDAGRDCLVDCLLDVGGTGSARVLEDGSYQNMNLKLKKKK
jgi:hypothetical protein